MAAPKDTDTGGPARAYMAWTRRAGLGWAAAVGLILAVAAARVVYLAWFCPYALVEDEAHYWEWSRRLDLSYYTKGPGVAWVIWASTSLLGHTELAVRLPAVIASAVTALCVAVLASDTAGGDARAAFLGVCVFLLTPIFQLTGLLMTIDGPYVACWALACVGAWRALEGRSWWGWPVLGIGIGAGILFKYTILLLPPAIVLYALLRRGRMGAARRPWAGVAVACALGLAGLAPVLIWNAGNGWGTVRHLLGHLGMPGGDVPPRQGAGEGLTYTPVWMLEFVGTQLALIGPVLILCVYCAFVAWRRRRSEARAWAGRLFLICCALPILVFYLAVTLVAPAEGNWPMAGYLSLIALCGWGVGEAMDTYRARVARWKADPARPREGILRRKPELHRQIAWHFSIGIGLFVAFGSLRLDLLVHTPVVGELIPIGRLSGADEIAAETDRLMEGLRRRTGREPFVIAQHYGRAGQLAFYLPGRPVVYCSSSRMGGRLTQYDFWEDTDLDDLGTLGGRPAVLLGATGEQWGHVFARVREHGVLDGEHKQDRLTFLGYNYRGWRQRAGPQPPPSADRTGSPRSSSLKPQASNFKPAP